MGSSRYSVEFKRAVVEKLLNRGTRGVTAILEEAGISSPTLYQMNDCREKKLYYEDETRKNIDLNRTVSNYNIRAENVTLAGEGWAFLKSQSCF